MNVLPGIFQYQFGFLKKMPPINKHISQAQSNISFLNSFFLQYANDWAITVMFYSSLHAVEAMIFCEASQRSVRNDFEYELHSKTHDHRERQVKGLFPDIHSAYLELSQVADNARYKVYKFRPDEVTFNFQNYFKPIVEFFNSYFTSKPGYSLNLNQLDGVVNSYQTKSQP